MDVKVGRAFFKCFTFAEHLPIFLIHSFQNNTNLHTIMEKKNNLSVCLKAKVLMPLMTLCGGIGIIGYVLNLRPVIIGGVIGMFGTAMLLLGYNLIVSLKSVKSQEEKVFYAFLGVLFFGIVVIYAIAGILEIS